ncbi:TetR/AcrR family transcriptional regulator [Microbispora sp. ATCC PTA-5024]|uniref:TetR/AcrR family transcriptional regulator n=1 Tax=Microbispora sp. ATCC PTA-5024 TaxID=316330 RepID=UPI0003DBF7B2|nr:helix-turn-helix domain-containing protein [Microbispora sp. ATCC PTA-5024]ETK31619.1 TetR family transcriptional regulator [Microbispora sp. ATCC PTA-5024]
MPDLLAQRRPHRADAARNFDALVAAAREVFAEHGGDASMDEIARRAGVGNATLYRNFPTREALVEVVYLSEVQAVCDHAERLAGAEDPFGALVEWLRRLVEVAGTKRVLIEGLAFNPSAYPVAREALYEAGGALVARAHEAGRVDPGLDIDDVMRFAIGVSVGVYRDDDQRERVFQAAMRGIGA